MGHNNVYMFSIFPIGSPSPPLFPIATPKIIFTASFLLQNPFFLFRNASPASNQTTSNEIFIYLPIGFLHIKISFIYLSVSFSTLISMYILCQSCKLSELCGLHCICLRVTNIIFCIIPASPNYCNKSCP